jgi:hypothetical protein
MAASIQIIQPSVLKDYPRQFPKAVAVALTRTAYDVQGALTDGMASTFDRPTPFTMRAFRVDMAKAGQLESVVWAQPQQARYLFWQIEGGDRASKGFERRMQLFGGEVALPGAGARLNSYGNMSMAFIKSASNSGGGGGRYFVGTPRNRSSETEGVWERMASGGLRLAMLFADHAKYEERFDMEGIASKTVSDRFPSQLMRAMQQYGG